MLILVQSLLVHHSLDGLFLRYFCFFGVLVPVFVFYVFVLGGLGLVCSSVRVWFGGCFI